MADLCVSQSSSLVLKPKIGVVHNLNLNSRTAISLSIGSGGGAHRQLQYNSLSYRGFGSSSDHPIRKLGAVSDTKASTIFTVDSATRSVEVQPEIGGGGGGVSGGRGGGGGGGGGGGDNSNGKGEDGPDEKSNKKGMSMSQKLTLGYAVLVGVGGVMGFLKSGSQKSLLSGGISAALLYFVYTELPIRPVLASSIGLGLSAALLGVMGTRYKRSGKIFPAGIVSVVSLVMTGGYLHGILRSLH